MEYVTVPMNEYVQLIRYKEIIEMFENVLHEKEFKKEFVKEVENIRKEVKKGHKISFKNTDEMNNYLDRL
ncbi:MAG: hypothetical protein WC568_10710 [Candidatus Methanoperedens sp.]